MEVRGVGLNRSSFKRRIFTTYLLANSFLNTALNQSSFIKNQLKNVIFFQKKL